jgi:hypothetical protein
MPLVATKQSGVAVTLQICVWEVLSLNIGQDTDYPVLCGSSQFLKENIGIVP